MSKAIYRVLPAAVQDTSPLSETLISFLRFLSPAFIRYVLKVDSVQIMGTEKLVNSFHDFQDGNSRLMLVFRHPYGEEPQILGHTILNVLPKAARRLGNPLKHKTHAHFIHGYEVPLWSPPPIGWLLPRAGALPVHHSKLDSKGLSRLRSTMLDGPYPLALAPEGQVSYSSQSLPRMERGFAHIGLWCADDLEKAGRKEQVSILPLSIHYNYGKRGPKILEKALSLLEHECSIIPSSSNPIQRLKEAAHAIVQSAENFYAELKRQKLQTTHNSDHINKTLKERWEHILEIALETAEKTLNIPNNGDIITRVYNIRQCCWDRIYRPFDKNLSPLERRLQDREAGEAYLAMRHMETVDIGWYIDFDANIEKDSVDLLIERALNYVDVTNRLQGGNLTNRPNLGKKKVCFVVGTPIDIRSRSNLLGQDRKTQIDLLAGELEKEFLNCIDIYQKEHQNGKQ
ncbi:MAG TPA: hypothetical protein VJ861_08540 [Treponemataceae bacterium]|nr:hypothetical protein [Treponemataceae bacterium]